MSRITQHQVASSWQLVAREATPTTSYQSLTTLRPEGA